MTGDQYIQVGYTAMRGPDGQYLPAVPLYIRREEGAAEAEDQVIRDIGHLLALRMKTYVESTKALQD